MSEAPKGAAIIFEPPGQYLAVDRCRDRDACADRASRKNPVAERVAEPIG